MLEILEKYNKLPQHIRDNLHSESFLSAIRMLESQYNINLSAVITRAVVGDIKIRKLARYLRKEFKIDRKQAKILVKVLKGIINSKSDSKEKKIIPKKVIPKDNLDAFSKADEKEIKQIAKNMEKAQVSPSKKVDDNVKNILEQVQINFSSELLIDRFKIIIKANLSGVRNNEDTREVLLKPFDQAGVGLSSEEVEKVINILEKYKADHKIITTKQQTESPTKVPTTKLPEKKLEIARDIEYNLADEIKSKVKSQKSKVMSDSLQQQSKLTENQKPDTTLKARDLPNLDKQILKPTIKQIPAKGLINKDAAYNTRDTNLAAQNKVKNVNNISGVLKPGQTVRPVPMQSQARKQTTLPKRNIETDKIKKMPRTRSPEDELRYLNLVDFRRLHRNPKKAILKIEEKINLLGDYKYIRKIEGIKAWRESPLNKIYLHIGQLGIANNMSVKDVIDRLGQTDSLSQEEFDAVSKLNYKLRFN